VYSYQYPHPAVTVDCAIFGLDEGEIKVLLIERNLEPFKGRWALPGGFVKLDEDIDAAARRELEEETGVKKVFLEQVSAFGSPGRDPRERVITIAYYAIVNLHDHKVRADTDAREAAWFPADRPPSLAFDHRGILRASLAKLRDKTRREPIFTEFLPRKFTLTQLQLFYESVLGKELDKRNFRKNVLSYGVIEDLDEFERGAAHRAARLFRFDSKAWARLKKSGRSFEV
jgi:8-oxo-dGTP diphosphatase